MRLLVLVTALLVVSPFARGQDAGAPGAAREVPPFVPESFRAWSGELDVELVEPGRAARPEDQVVARARLEPEEERGPNGEVVVRLVKVEPASRASNVEWVWCHLPTGVTLRLLDGRLVAHPDLRVVDELRAHVTPAVEVEAVIAGLGRLRRLASRGAMLAALPPLDELPPASRAALLDALTTERARWTLGAGPDGCPAGGAPDDALCPTLQRVARASALERPDADRVLASALALSRYTNRGEVALILAGREPLLPPSALVGAADDITGDDARRLLLALAGRASLDVDGARAVLSAGLRLSSYVHREQVLGALVGEGEGRGLLTVAEVLAATRHITSDGQHGRLARLAARAGLSREDAARVLAVALQQSNYVHRERVLDALVGKDEGRGLLTVAEVLAATRHITSDGQRGLLKRIARRADLTRPDALLVLEVGLALSNHVHREEVLALLIGEGEGRGFLDVARLLAATQHITSDGQRAHLTRLAARPNLSREDAARVLAVGLQLTNYVHREHILRVLVGEGGGRGLLDVAAIVAATEHITSDGQHELLLLLARRDPIERADAERVLRAALQQQSYAHREKVLAAVVGTGEGRGLLDVEGVLAATTHITSEGQRAHLLALARRERLTAAEARRVLSVGLEMSSYAHREQLLAVLIGTRERPRALLELRELLKAGEHITSDGLHELLLLLARRTSLSPDDARAVLAVGLNQSSYTARAAVLAALMGPAGEPRPLLEVSAIIEAADQIASDEQRRILLGLARRPELGADDARLVLAAALRQSSYAARAETLDALIGDPARPLLSVADIVAAASEVGSDDHDRIVIALARRPSLEAGETTLLIGAAGRMSRSSRRADVLVALVGKAPRRALTDAARELDRDSERRVLTALADQGD